MSLTATLPSFQYLSDPAQRAFQEAAVVLTVVHYHGAPERVGEVLIPPSGAPGPRRLFGRGEGDSDDPHPRLVLLRARPSGQVGAPDFEAAPPLDDAVLSRRQLVLHQASPAVLQVENVGRRRLIHNGVEVTEARVSPGDLLAVGPILFLCGVRQLQMGPWPDNRPPRRHRFGAADAHGIVGETDAAWEMRRQIALAARQGAHVLILGPSGAGKELVARAIHELSSRSERRLVDRNAATIPEALIEAELFGNARGYPNPGMAERPGLIGEADGGTLFLDEIGELPESHQARLLRVLDAGHYSRLGEAVSRRADVRIIAATHRSVSDLKQDLAARFPIRVTLPGLGDRREDVHLLARHLLQRILGERGQYPPPSEAELPPISPSLLTALLRHRWSTHVRELDFLIRQALDAWTGGSISRCPPLEATAAPVGGSPSPQMPASRPPLRSPAADAVAEDPRQSETFAFSPDDVQVITLMRQHRFSGRACGDDDAYPGNEQAASRHLRVMICRALALTGWELEAAARLLGGAELELQILARRRIEAVVQSFARRLETEDTESLEAAIKRQYRSEAPYVQQLLTALRMGTLTP